MSHLLVRPAFALDTEAALGPQLVAARAQAEPVAWKMLARATGLSERHLRNLHAATRAGWATAGADPKNRVVPFKRNDKRHRAAA